jgi:FkbH-like protein
MSGHFGTSADLESDLERYLSASGETRPETFRNLVRALKATIDAGEMEAARAALRRAILPGLDYTSVQSLLRIHQRLRREQPATTPLVRLAVLSGFTLDQLAPLIDLNLAAAGAGADIYTPAFGTFRQEILAADSGLYAFAPKVVFLATGWRDLAHVPLLTDDRDRVRERVRLEVRDLAALWQTLHDRVGCQILQNTFDLPPWRTLSNHDRRHPAGLGSYLAQVNQALAEEAPAFVTLHDVDHLAASAGRWVWHDERFFHHAKVPCAPECLMDYAHSVAAILGAQIGLSRKCLVLDLDNTLWGGVIGDDGLGGIRLGQGDAESEAFHAFQKYVKGLRNRGVILAVCSKNEDHIAREVFEKHPEMILRLDDIATFVANWDDKATNLRTIALNLNIGLNALVLADDSPVERALVRRLAPEVAVPELPVDPAGYVEAIERHRYFELVSLGQEDFKRAEYYRVQAVREQAQASAASVEEFLESLQMTARVGPIDTTTLERSAQLIARSNQFNLTTRRRSTADILALTADDSWITLTVKLADRFGDYGLISVLLARVRDDRVEIDTWLMSCRVLKRTVEDLVLNHLAEAARRRGGRLLRGDYIPTPKNDLVREHYPRLGFLPAGAGDSGSTSWDLPIAENWQPRRHFISVTTVGA